MAKQYERVNWSDYPSKSTPIIADNLNKMDRGIDLNDTRLSDAEVRMDGFQGEITSLESDMEEVKDIVEDLNNVATGTLIAGQTSLMITASFINNAGMIDIYTDKYGVSPTECVVTNNTITMTFESLENDLNVKVRCM